ncbi:hypothetical protein [Tateyamaria sp.]|uniref:hypothetical protein n=1 Tax=Tateyamaria sp. TaxID=1929288 RepID=UPI0032A137CF
MQRFLIAALAAACLSTAASAASLQSCEIDRNNHFWMQSAAGAECFTGNDTNQIDKNWTMFGQSDWTLIGKNDGGDDPFKVAPINGTNSGLSFIKDIFDKYDKVVVTLKAGNGFGAFLLDGTSEGFGWFSKKDLSHASIYGLGEKTVDTSPVPLPMNILLLSSAIAGFGMWARKQRRT